MVAQRQAILHVICVRNALQMHFIYLFRHGVFQKNLVFLHHEQHASYIFSGLKIMADRSAVKMSGQLDFRPVTNTLVYTNSGTNHKNLFRDIAI